MHDFSKNSILLSTIYIGIIKGFFTDIHRNQPIGKNEFLRMNTYDPEYIENWLNCAYSNNLILYSKDKKIILTKTGEKYVFGSGHDSEIVEVLRAVFNIIIANKSFDRFDNKQEPDNSIIFDKEFAHLIPHYKLISQETYANIAEKEIISNPEIAVLLHNSKIIDYGCGSGWFIDLLQSKYPYNQYIGIDDEKIILNIQSNSEYETISYNQEIPCFDVLFLNRVLHHLGKKLDSTLKSIVQKMNKDAHIVIWEFNWNEEDSVNFCEMAYSNLIECIQGNTFLKLDDIQNKLMQLGLQTHSIFINNHKDFILIANK